MAVDKALAMKYLIETLSPTVSLSPSGISSVNYTYFDYWVNLGLADMTNPSTNQFTPEQVAQIEANKNNLIKVVDDVNALTEKDAAQDIKIDAATTLASEVKSTADINAANTAKNVLDITQLQTEYQDLAKDINDLTADKASKDELSAALTNFSLQTDEHGWNTLYTAGAEVVDYPPNDQAIQYPLNSKIKLLDVDENAYIIVVVKDLKVQSMGLIQTLNRSGDPIRYTQTTDDYICECVWTYADDKSTIDINFLKEGTLNIEIILLKIPIKENTDG